jgi:hypothetical protein
MSVRGSRKMPDWRSVGTASIVDRRGAMRHRRAVPTMGTWKEAFTTMDARSNVNDMSTSSEERRRAEAALVRAIDMDPSVEASTTTHAALCRYVDLLVDDGLLPEAVVIAFKSVITGAASLQQFEGDVREELRSALVSACIQRYFAPRPADDVRITSGPVLRLVRDELEQPRHVPSPEPSA